MSKLHKGDFSYEYYTTKGAKIITESDRKKAIALALSLVKKDEIIAILGKGDEDYQEINGVKHPFSDAAVVRELLKTKPY